MTIEELIRDYDFSSNVRNEMFIAYDESREGFERVCRKAAGMKNPAGALTSMIRAGQHLKVDAPGSDKPPHDTLEEVAHIALRAFNAKKRKYGYDDYDYGSWVASTWNGRYSLDEIGNALRQLLREPGPDTTPAPCPPALLARMQLQAGRIGVMPKDAPEPTLAERLLAMVEKAA